jgi:hypothetical protein
MESLIERANNEWKKEPDMVDNPPHYNHGSIETIDCIISALGEFEAISYCVGNALKYQHRMWHKGSPIQDLKKSRWYIDKAIELLEKTKGENW